MLTKKQLAKLREYVTTPAIPYIRKNILTRKQRRLKGMDDFILKEMNIISKKVIEGV